MFTREYLNTNTNKSMDFSDESISVVDAFNVSICRAYSQSNKTFFSWKKMRQYKQNPFNMWIQTKSVSENLIKQKIEKDQKK